MFLRSVARGIREVKQVSDLKRLASDLGRLYIDIEKRNPQHSQKILFHVLVECFYATHGDDCLPKMERIIGGGHFCGLENCVNMIAVHEGVGPEIGGYNKALQDSLALRETIVREVLEGLGIGEKVITGIGITREETDAYAAWKVDHPLEKRWRGK